MFNFLSLIASNKKLLGLGVAAVLFVGLGMFAFVQTNRLDAAKAENAAQESQIEEQSKTINRMADLRDFADKQNREREAFVESLRQQSASMENELNELKAQNKEYRECSESDLPYSIDGMFGNTNDQANNS